LFNELLIAKRNDRDRIYIDTDHLFPDTNQHMNVQYQLFKN